MFHSLRCVSFETWLALDHTTHKFFIITLNSVWLAEIELYTYILPNAWSHNLSRFKWHPKKNVLSIPFQSHCGWFKFVYEFPWALPRSRINYTSSSHIVITTTSIIAAVYSLQSHTIPKQINKTFFCIWNLNTNRMTRCAYPIAQPQSTKNNNKKFVWITRALL